MGYSGNESWRTVEASGTRSAYRWETITPSDSGAIGPCRWIRCETAGYLEITNENGDSVILTVAAGENIYVQGEDIIVGAATSTTAIRFW